MFFKTSSYKLMALLLAACVYSCTPVDIEIPENEPVFVVETGISSIDSVLQLNAGDDGIFMCTDFVNESGYNVYSGTFTTEDGCDDFVAPYLNFKLKASESTDMGIEEALQQGDLAYYEPGQTTLQHLLFGFTDNPQGTFSWYTAGSINPIEADELVLTVDQSSGTGVDFTGVYEVPGIFSASFTKPIFGFGNANCGLNIEVSGNINQGTSEIVITGFEGAVTWSNGGFGGAIVVESPGVYSAQVIDSAGCFIDLVVQLDQVGFNDSFNFGFEHITQEIPGPALEGLLVDITYLNDEGVLYTSSLLPQLIDPDFTILSVEDFDVNVDGLPTKKIEARFSAMLVGDNGDVIVLENAEVVFAVAYEE